MAISELVLEYLKIIISWPVVAIIILFSLKKEILSLMEKLPQRLKSAKIGGQTLEFYAAIDTDSKMRGVLENIQKENPELLKRSLANAGLVEDEYEKYQSNIKKRVIQIQRFLQDLGYDLGASGIDGITGPDTKRAVREFQKDHGLPVDGIVGPQTLRMILKVRNND